MITVALVGAGRWGRKLAKSFAERAYIKSVASLGNKENLDKLCDLVPNICVSSLQNILSDNEIDAVIVASPINTLGNIAIKCLKSGKHVFLEKPGAHTSKQIKLIQSAKGDKVCLINYLYLVDPTYLSFKQALSPEKVIEANFVWHKWGSFSNDILLNLFSHDAALLIDCLGIIPTKRHTNISENSCKLSLDCGSLEVNIHIDRQKKEKIKTVMFKTDTKKLIWKPGYFLLQYHNGYENVKATSSSDLIDEQRDRFINHVTLNDGFTNLNLAESVLRTIQEIRE